MCFRAYPHFFVISAQRIELINLSELVIYIYLHADLTRFLSPSATLENTLIIYL